MLSNTLTLQVDVLNNATLVPTVFTRVDEFQNRSVYKGPTNSLIQRDQLSFYRTRPTKSGNFNGVAKSSLKFTKDVAVNGVDTTTSIMAPQLCEISFSLPVGFTAAQALELRQRAIAALDDDALMGLLTEELEV